MKIAIMQPYFFPYIGYFQLINSVDKFIVYDDVNFINKGWINRNNILVNNKSHMITVPLKESSQNKLIYSIEVLEDQKWKIKLLKTIRQNYKKAPYFESVYSLLEFLINQEHQKISSLNTITIKAICSYLSIQTLIIPSSTIYNNDNLKGQERILSICETEKADQYINPIGGKEIYSKSIFEKKEILLNFLKSEPFEYRQFSHPFIPWLSIIDLIMFNSKSELAEILNLYTLE